MQPAAQTFVFGSRNCANIDVFFYTEIKYIFYFKKNTHFRNNPSYPAGRQR